jgi:hypothetical protein
LGEEELLILIDDGKRENRLDVSGNFEIMEVSRDSFESLKSWKNFTNLFTDLGAELGIW